MITLEGTMAWASIISALMSLGIVVFSYLSFFYGLKNISLNKVAKENYPGIRHVLPVVISAFYGAVFLYLLVNEVFSNTIIDPYSFGSIFIRPIILLSSVSQAINIRVKYYNSLRRIKKYEELGGKLWSTNH